MSKDMWCQPLWCDFFPFTLQDGKNESNQLTRAWQGLHLKTKPWPQQQQTSEFVHEIMFTTPHPVVPASVLSYQFFCLAVGVSLPRWMWWQCSCFRSAPAGSGNAPLLKERQGMRALRSAVVWSRSLKDGDAPSSARFIKPYPGSLILCLNCL